MLLGTGQRRPAGVQQDAGWVRPQLAGSAGPHRATLGRGEAADTAISSMQWTSPRRLLHEGCYGLIGRLAQLPRRLAAEALGSKPLDLIHLG